MPWLVRDCSEPASPSQCPPCSNRPGKCQWGVGSYPFFLCPRWFSGQGLQTKILHLGSTDATRIPGKSRDSMNWMGCFIFTIADFAHFLPLWMETTNHSGIHSTRNTVHNHRYFPNFLQWSRRLTILQLPDYASYDTHHSKLLNNLLMQKHLYQSVAAIFSIILIITEF